MNYNLPKNKLKEIDSRLSESFLIPKINKVYVPIITTGCERPTTNAKTTTVNNKSVPKPCVLLVYMQDVQSNHPFLGRNTKEISKAIEKILKNAIEDELFNKYDLTVGIDFDVALYDKLRYQTFVLNTTDRVEQGHKVRIAIAFDNNKTTQQAKQVLKEAAKRQPEDYPWQVYELKSKKHYLYWDTDIYSMFIHWLTDIDFETVCRYIYHFRKLKF